MDFKLLLVAFFCLTCHAAVPPDAISKTASSGSGSTNTNSKNEENDINAFAEVASSFLKSQNAESIGGMVNNFVQSDGGKHLGEMLMNMASHKNTNDILQSLNSVVNPKEGGGGFDPTLLTNVLGALSSGGGNKEGGGFDPSILTSVLGVLSSGGGNKEGGGFDPSILANVLGAFSSGTGNKEGGGGPDILGMLSMLSSLGGLGGGNKGSGFDNVMGILNTVVDAVDSFTGEDAHKREAEHASHAWLLPPIVERIHILFDHFLNSDLGKGVMKALTNEKVVRAFTDERGKLSLAKFVELLENQSFRKQWIELVTKRIAQVISFFIDPKIQHKFMITIQNVVNGFFKAQGFPKQALFDPTRPTETISNFVNYASKRYLNYKISSKQYVKPYVDYFQEVLTIAKSTGIFMGRGVDSSHLSHKLADTINLEIIEPVARVYRAYRFGKKRPECARYVMCLINQYQPDDTPTIPGLKTFLSKSMSLFASWFLSGHTDISFWSFYHYILEEPNCQAKFIDTCTEFHVEEIKVTTDYVHNEL